MLMSEQTPVIQDSISSLLHLFKVYFERSMNNGRGKGSNQNIKSYRGVNLAVKLTSLPNAGQYFKCFVLFLTKVNRRIILQSTEGFNKNCLVSNNLSHGDLLKKTHKHVKIIERTHFFYINNAQQT